MSGPIHRLKHSFKRMAAFVARHCHQRCIDGGVSLFTLSCISHWPIRLTSRKTWDEGFGAIASEQAGSKFIPPVHVLVGLKSFCCQEEGRRNAEVLKDWRGMG